MEAEKKEAAGNIGKRVTAATAAIHPDDRKINKNLVKDRQPKPIWEWLTFFIIAGGGVYLMWRINQGETHLGRIYFPARMVILPVIYLWVIFSAFKESYLPGVFAILLPPYTFYFGISRTDYRILRGAMAGLVLCLLVEIRFIPERSFFSKVDSTINQIIGKGRGAIEAAQ